MTAEPRWDAVVVGSGIAGLTAARSLRRRGQRVLVVEARSRVGGVIRTETRGPWRFELGPNTVLERPPLPGILEELGLAREAYRVPVGGRSRFVWHRGRLHRVPRTPLDAARSRLFSLRAKLDLLAEPWRGSRSGGEETIAELVRRRLSAEWLDTLVGPFVSGIYAGDPERLSARWTLGPLVALEAKHGSLIRGLRASRAAKGGKGLAPRTMVSFPGGLARLVERLGSEAGEIRTGAPVESMSRGADGGFRLELRGETIRTPRVVLAVPAGSAAGLLREMTDGESRVLDRIAYAPLVVAGFGFAPGGLARTPRGTGFLVPRGGDLRILGCLCPSNLFPSRAPDGGVNLTVFLGGALDPEPVTWDGDHLLATARRDLDRVYGVEGEPEVTVVRSWPGALPQYVVGHQDRLNAVERWEERFPGLALAGSYLRGVALPDTMESGLRAANRVAGLEVGRPALVDSAPS